MFDIYLAGSKTRTEDIIREAGFNRLYSQYVDRNYIKDYLQERGGKLLIDSGAFTAHRRHAIIDVDEYINYINTNTENIDYFIQLDEIPGKFAQLKTFEDYQQATVKSWDNFLYMRERVNEPDKLWPVFHYGESFEVLERMLDYVDRRGNPIRYIGISPANDTGVNIKVEWIRRVFSFIAKHGRKDVKTHALGMTSLNVLETYPFTSADSTSWIMCGSNGSIMTPMGVVNLSNVQKNNPDNIINLHPHAKEAVLKYVDHMGFDVERLKHEYAQRILFNAFYLKEWAENYEFKGNNILKTSLF